MRRYCLTYDAEGSEDWPGDTLRREIIKMLLIGGATELHSPVESTIIFDDALEPVSIERWNGAILERFGEGIHYYLSLVAVSERVPVARERSNRALAIRFLLIVIQVQQEL